VRRQLLSLISALERDGVHVTDPSSYSIFQYNPPYTLPWLRRNEVLVQVRLGRDEDEEDEEVAAVPVAQQQTPTETAPAGASSSGQSYLDQLSTAKPTEEGSDTD
jgi:hypothetical protein